MVLRYISLQMDMLAILAGTCEYGYAMQIIRDCPLYYSAITRDRVMKVNIACYDVRNSETSSHLLHQW